MGQTAIFAHFPCGWEPCTCFVLFVCFPTCVLILAAQERLVVKVGCVWFRNSTRKRAHSAMVLGQWDQLSPHLTLPICTSSVLETRKGHACTCVCVCIHIYTSKAKLVGNSQGCVTHTQPSGKQQLSPARLWIDPFTSH